MANIAAGVAASELAPMTRRPRHLSLGDLDKPRRSPRSIFLIPRKKPERILACSVRPLR